MTTTVSNSIKDRVTEAVTEVFDRVALARQCAEVEAAAVREAAAARERLAVARENLAAALRKIDHERLVTDLRQAEADALTAAGAIQNAEASTRRSLAASLTDSDRALFDAWRRDLDTAIAEMTRRMEGSRIMHKPTPAEQAAIAKKREADLAHLLGLRRLVQGIFDLRFVPDIAGEIGRLRAEHGIPSDD